MKVRRRPARAKCRVARCRSRFGQAERGTEVEDRLSRMIERLVTQRACIDHAVAEIDRAPGVILEIGLGKGRTYDRLRTLMPRREIFAFDRLVHCPEEVRPDRAHLFLGDFRETLDAACRRLGAHCAALVHADVGSEDRGADASLAAEIAPLIDRLLRYGGLVLSDREMPFGSWEARPRPPGAGDWPYFLYRRRGGAGGSGPLA